MATQQRYTKILQKIKQEYSDELSDEINEEIDSLLETRDTLPTLEQADKFMSVIAKILQTIETVSDWL